jgi:hypothetical protein
MELQKKNQQSIKQYEFLKHTLFAVAVNTLQPPGDPSEYGPPKHTLTGDTLGATSVDRNPPNGKGEKGDAETCLCGQVSSNSATSDAHMMPAELEEYATKVDTLLSRVQDGRRRLGRFVISPSLGCEETRRQLESLSENLQVVLVWQMSALFETQVTIQEPTNRMEIHTETHTIQIGELRHETQIPGSTSSWQSRPTPPMRMEIEFEPETIQTGDVGHETRIFERASSWRSRPKQWVLQLIHPNRSRKSGTESHSAPTQGAIVPGSATWPVIVTPQGTGTSADVTVPAEQKQTPLPVPVFKIPEPPEDDAAEPKEDSDVVNRLLEDWTTLDTSEIKQSEVDSA